MSRRETLIPRPAPTCRRSSKIWPTDTTAAWSSSPTIVISPRLRPCERHVGRQDPGQVAGSLLGASKRVRGDIVGLLSKPGHRGIRGAGLFDMANETFR